MARYSLIHILRVFFFVFALKLAFGAEPAQAATCQSDPRFVQVLGVYPNATPAGWQGKTVCLFTGTGYTDPQTVAGCSSPGRQIATFGGYHYCLWDSTSYLTAVIMSDLPNIPTEILFPRPQASSEVRDTAGNFTEPNHCTKDTRFVQTLGTWRNVTLCLWEGTGVGNPIATCPDAAHSLNRVRTYPTDFANPPPPSTMNPVGTRYCVTSVYHRWEYLGTRAAIMATQATTRVCVAEYVDGNGNGVRDAGESPKTGVAFVLVGYGAQISDVAGQACFTVPQGGSYTVRESVPGGWVNTSPGVAPFQKTVTVQANQWATATFGNAQLTTYDLGIDSHLARPLPPAGQPTLLRIWISGIQTIPAGRELVVEGGLSSPQPFPTLTSAAVATAGWTCTGHWGAFVCRTTLATPLTTPRLLELRTSYAASYSGQNVAIVAGVKITNNNDPTPANNNMVVNTTLY